MIHKSALIHQHPLNSKELDLCQRAFDSFLGEWNIPRDSEEAERAAAMIIKLYQRGVHDDSQLVMLTGVTQGKA